MKKLKIDPEFLNLTIPNNEEQQKILEDSLMSEGCKKPIVVWNDVIIDGHKRYALCSVEEIEYETMNVYFLSRERAIAWVCENRLKDLSAGTPIHKYLSGKMYMALRPHYLKLCKEGAYEYPREADGRVRIAKLMAKDLGINSYSSIETSATYAYFADKVARSDLDIFRGVMAGEIKVTVNEMRLLSKGDQKTRSKIKKRLSSNVDVDAPEKNNVKKSEEVSLTTKIKEMPSFDPDMTIKGLTLTIPTWMSAIARAEEKTDMSQVSDYAKNRLIENLIRLDEQIRQMLMSMS